MLKSPVNTLPVNLKLNEILKSNLGEVIRRGYCSYFERYLIQLLD